MAATRVVCWIMIIESRDNDQNSGRKGRRYHYNTTVVNPPSCAMDEPFDWEALADCLTRAIGKHQQRGSPERGPTIMPEHGELVGRKAS